MSNFTGGVTGAGVTAFQGDSAAGGALCLFSLVGFAGEAVMGSNKIAVLSKVGLIAFTAWMLFQMCVITKSTGIENYSMYTNYFLMGTCALGLLCYVFAPLWQRENVTGYNKEKNSWDDTRPLPKIAKPFIYVPILATGLAITVCAEFKNADWAQAALPYFALGLAVLAILRIAVKVFDMYKKGEFEGLTLENFIDGTFRFKSARNEAHENQSPPTT